MSQTMTNVEAGTVDLGELAPQVQARIDSGEDSSAAEVITAALEALEREEAAFEETLRRAIQESYDDPRPSIPAEEVFRQLREHHAERTRVRKNAT
jgi:antitoxin ParD1/3/4